MDNNIANLKELRTLIDSYLSKGLFTRVNEEYYGSGRVILALAMAFNKAIDSNDPKYDEFINDYYIIEKQLGNIIKKLKHTYKNRKIAVDTLDNNGKPIVVNLDSTEYFELTLDNLQRILKKRKMVFNSKMFN